MSQCDPGALVIRAERAVLEAAASPLVFKSLLSGDAAQERWRVVRVNSAAALPFQVRIEIATGGSDGPVYECTGSTGVLVCVAASSLTVKVANRASVENPLRASVADGLWPTRNQFETTGSLEGGGGTASHAIPLFATHVRVDAADFGALPNAVLELIDGAGNLMGQVAGDAQPSGGVPLGGSRQVRVTSTGAIQYRLVFQLGL